jgi:hypothetical protein
MNPNLGEAGPGPLEARMGLKDIILSASVAVGNTASRERDREVETRSPDGRPRPMGDRAKGRVQAIVTEGTAKIVVAETAHYGAKELAKRVTGEGLKKALGFLAKSPAASAGTALFAFDVARDGYRLARGSIDTGEFAERVGGNAVGIAGAATGAWVGSIVGSFAMPVVGTMLGSVIGGVVGGVGGDTFGRKKVRGLLGYSDELDDDDDEYDDDE